MNQTRTFEDLLQLIARGFHLSGAYHLGGLDMTFQQFVVMKFIFQKEYPKMTDLAEELNVTMGNVTTMIDRLIKQHYVTRKDDPEDRRVVRVCLTAEGKHLMGKVAEVRRKNMAMILNKISKEDQASLFKIMEKLVKAIQKEREEEAK